jgi:hypothetical protein
MRSMDAVYAVAGVFAAVALLGLLAARRPDVFAQYFLAKWQRDRLTGNMGGLAWTGWVLFVFGVFASILTLVVAGAVHR